MSINRANIKTVCSYFHIASTLFLFCTIPFYFTSYTQYGLIFFFSSFIIDYVVNQRWKEGFKLDIGRVVSIFLILQFVLLLIFGFFEQDPRYLSTYYEYRTSLLGFGIVGLLGVSKKFNIRQFAYVSIVPVIIFLCLLISKIPDYFYDLEGISDKLQLLRYIRGTYITSHMLINLFLCVGMALFSKLMAITSSKKEKVLCVLMILIYYSLVMLSEGRIGMLNANLVLVCILLRLTIKNLKYMIPLALFIGIGALMALYIAITDNSIKHHISFLNKTNPREYIWRDGVKLIQESPFIGLGASTNAVRVKECLLSDEELCRIDDFLINNINNGNVYAMHTHNQIMQSWQEYGLIGLLAILSLFACILILSRRSLTMVVIFGVVFIQLITDVIDGGTTNLGFCMYVFLLLALFYSQQMGKEKVSSSDRVLCSPGNA